MVPVAVEFVAMEIEFGPVLVGDLDPGRIRVGVQLAAHPQPASGRGGCDQLQNDFVTNPGLTTMSSIARLYATAPRKPTSSNSGQLRSARPVPITGWQAPG